VHTTVKQSAVKRSAEFRDVHGFPRSQKFFLEAIHFVGAASTGCANFCPTWKITNAGFQKLSFLFYKADLSDGN